VSDATSVVGLAIDSDTIVGEGGFLALRRVRARNRRADGSLSSPFVCDFVHRPYGQDAVVVVLYRRTPAGAVWVLLRDGLRPALSLGRDAARAPLPEPPPGLFHRELVAGIVEHDDRGVDGLLRRAAEESAEEAGVHVLPEQLRLLGAGTLPSPGSMVEKFYFAAAEVDAASLPFDEAEPDPGAGARAAKLAAPPAGDGSPMEEDARLVWMELDAAIAASLTGELCDAKTELGLRRLRDDLRA
jgi:ADP-ribose pyrophosphatase